MGEAEINDNDPCKHHPQCNVLIAGIATVRQWVSFGGPSEWLVASLFVTTGLGTESTNSGDVKLLNGLDQFFVVDCSNSI